MTSATDFAVLTIIETYSNAEKGEICRNIAFTIISINITISLFNLGILNYSIPVHTRRRLNDDTKNQRR